MTFSYHRTVRLADTDAAGVMYFASILPICHEAYEESLREVGINFHDFVCNSATVLPIVHAEVDFFRPLLCGDELLVELTPRKVNETELKIAYRIIKVEQPDKPSAQALTRHVCIQADSRKRTTLPESIQHWLSS